MNYLLDTCVVSELVNKSPDENVVDWLRTTPPEQVYLSVITIGEVRKGISRLSESKRKKALSTWLDDALLNGFEGRIIALDVEIRLVWGDLLARLEQRGRLLPAIDSLLAVVALQGDYQLVTRNLKDFVGTGVALLNPWD